MTNNEKLLKVIERIKNQAGIDIDGKNYNTVAQRVQAIREVMGFDIKFKSVIKSFDGNMCIAEAFIYVRNETTNEFEGICNANVVEYAQMSNINRKNIIENAETSAIGRCLAFLGLTNNTSIASADEIKSKTEKEGVNGVVSFKAKTKEEKSQEKKQLEGNITNLRKILSDNKLDEETYLKSLKVESFEKMTKEQITEEFFKLVTMFNEDSEGF